VKHEIDQLKTDPLSAPFHLDRHPADLPVIAMRNHSRTPYCALAGKRDHVERARIVVVHLDRFGHALLFDENAPADVIGHPLEAIVGSYDHADIVGSHPG
jgi:hypothetical protein